MIQYDANQITLLQARSQSGREVSISQYTVQEMILFTRKLIESKPAQAKLLIRACILARRSDTIRKL